jgi:hypothetical protein
MKTTKAQESINRRERCDAAAGVLAETKENQRVIQASMRRWRAHNKYGLSVGRGLSESELIDKVAGETGASKKHIRTSLRQKD